MTTPDGTPTGANPVRPRGFQHGDAGQQARPTGGGQFTGGGEARVIGVNQDTSATAGPEARTGLAKLKGNVSNDPASSAQFVRED